MWAEGVFGYVGESVAPHYVVGLDARYPGVVEISKVGATIYEPEVMVSDWTAKSKGWDHKKAESTAFRSVRARMLRR